MTFTLHVDADKWRKHLAKTLRAHRDHGVDLRTQVVVDSFVGEGRVTGIKLGDGSVVEADAVIVGSALAGTILRLSAGTYSIVSRYGDANAIVRAEIVVTAGKPAGVLTKLDLLEHLAHRSPRD